MADQFKETLNRFRDFSGYAAPMSWEEWVSIHDRDQMVAVLYCQFYDQITLAWYKARADFVPDEDGVSCVLQYLNKNVPIIEDEEDKFTPAYIYRVAYNCMDCLRYVQRDINRYNSETTNIVMYDGQELDLCDLVPHHDAEYEAQADRDHFWTLIASLGPEAEKVVNFLVNDESLRRVSKRSKEHDRDPLADVGVNEARKNEIIDLLRVKLAGFKSIYY